MRTYESARDKYPEPERGRCVTCGFLGKHRPDSHIWHEASPSDRETGRFFQSGTGYEREINTTPACFRSAFDIQSEYQDGLNAGPETAGSGDNLLTQTALAVIRADRHCSGWHPFTAGLTPKEHWDEVRMRELELDRRRHDLALAQLRTDSDERTRQITATLAEVARRTEHFTTTWTYAAFGVAVAALIVVTASYLFPEVGKHTGEAIIGVFTNQASPTPGPQVSPARASDVRP